MVGVLLGRCTLQLVYLTIDNHKHKTATAAITVAQQTHLKSQFWQPFWPTHANCIASINKARPALLVNAWRLSWVGQKDRQRPWQEQ